MGGVGVHARASYDVARDAEALDERTPRINWAAMTRILIAALIVPELIYFSRPIDLAILDGSRGWWLLIVQHRRTFAAVFSTAAIASVIFSWESFRVLIGEELRGPVKEPGTRAAFLAIHLAALTCLIAWTVSIVLTKRLDSADGPAWFFIGAGLSALLLFSWFAAILPAEPLIRWARMNHVAILGGIAVAIFARLVGVYALNLWQPLTASTLWGVDLLLRMLGQTTFVDAANARIGTSHFRGWLWGG